MLHKIKSFQKQDKSIRSRWRNNGPVPWLQYDNVNFSGSDIDSLLYWDRVAKATVCVFISVFLHKAHKRNHVAGNPDPVTKLFISKVPGIFILNDIVCEI